MKEQDSPYLKCAQPGCLRPGMVICEERQRKRVLRAVYCAKHAASRMPKDEQEQTS